MLLLICSWVAFDSLGFFFFLISSFFYDGVYGFCIGHSVQEAKSFNFELWGHFDCF